ncbi:MAG: DUF5106 domain-containing protein [Bacteroidales bacterium]|nr:DUF5106 domain-containing protein [Bacteroidales bacterium]
MLIPLLILVSCGGRKAGDVEAARAFPEMKVPAAVPEEERISYALTHYWDAFIKGADGFSTDSLKVAGVSMADMEKAAGTYASLVRIVPPGESAQALDALAAKLDEKGDTALFKGVASIVEKYLYDPQSPVRNEDAFGAFCAAASGSPLLTEAEKEPYAKWASLAALAAVGTTAPDFDFIDLAGRHRTLHGLRGEWTVLIFGNPDCAACRTLVEMIEDNEDLGRSVSEGTVSFVDIYVDEDIEAWRASVKDFPKDWTLGYDPSGIIRADTVYHLRAIPSIYLLDKDKKVVLKDAPEEVLIEYLMTI